MDKNINKDKDKNKNKDTDITDFIFDNWTAIGDTFINLRRHIREIWNIIPDLLYDIFAYIGRIIIKIYMRLRSRMLINITQDMNRLDIDKDIYDKIIQFDIKRILTSIIDENNKDQIIILKKMYKLLRKDQKAEYLEYCIENQGDTNFIDIRNKLINKLNSINNNSNAKIVDDNQNSVFITTVTSPTRIKRIKPYDDFETETITNIKDIL